MWVLGTDQTLPPNWKIHSRPIHTLSLFWTTFNTCTYRIIIYSLIYLSNFQYNRMNWKSIQLENETFSQFDPIAWASYSRNTRHISHFKIISFHSIQSGSGKPFFFHKCNFWFALEVSRASVRIRQLNFVHFISVKLLLFCLSTVYNSLRWENKINLGCTFNFTISILCNTWQDLFFFFVRPFSLDSFSFRLWQIIINSISIFLSHRLA